MADYLVLEEDGTSHLELEQNTDDILLEDGSLVFDKTGFGKVGGVGSGSKTGSTFTYTKTGFGKVGTVGSGIVELDLPPTEGASYKGGSFTVPGSTGSFSVTGVGFQPQVVLFFGSNKNTYDSVVSSGVAAVMRGTMVQDDTTGSIVSWCSSAVPHSAMRWEQQPIVCCDTSGTTGTDYQASAVSFDADGFTVNFSVVPGGTRKIHYVAIGDMHRTFQKTIGSHFGGTTVLQGVGWRIRSGLEIGGLDDTVQDIAGPNSEKTAWGHMLTWGGKSFQTDNTLSHNGMYLSAIDTPFTDQDDLEVFRSTGSTSYIGKTGNFLGPFLALGAVQMTLAGSSLRSVLLDVGDDNQGSFTGLLVHSHTGTVNTDNDLGDYVDIASANTNVEAPALLLFLGACGRESSADANPNAITFGFWTPDQSYCVAANGADDSFFQSEQYAWCSKVTGSGAHAGTVASLAPSSIGARLTTEVADVTAGLMAWHMFGPQLPRVRWIPHIYRMVMMT